MLCSDLPCHILKNQIRGLQALENMSLQVILWAFVGKLLEQCRPSHVQTCSYIHRMDMYLQRSVVVGS